VAIIIKGNKGFNIGGDLIKVDVPHNVELDISGNEGTDIGGHIVNLSVSVNSDSLASFVAEASEKFHELSPKQQQGFSKAVESLKSNDKASNQTALQWLYDLSVSIPGSAIASVILSFLSVGS
jgi:TctA family transporter